ncbi:hypothetical protein FRC12_006728 [Ceratobasidium sp. 428]|nr:hypothetical protein FRC12_006728 [Ceratobasidium sp. 428]
MSDSTTSPGAPTTSTTGVPATAVPITDVSVSVGSGMHKIDKLTGQDNYVVWRMRMVDILVDCGLYDYVDGTTIDPVTDPSASAKWKSNDRKALSAIRLRSVLGRTGVALQVIVVAWAPLRPKPFLSHRYARRPTARGPHARDAHCIRRA